MLCWTFGMFGRGQKEEGVVINLGGESVPFVTSYRADFLNCVLVHTFCKVEQQKK